MAAPRRVARLQSAMAPALALLVVLAAAAGAHASDATFTNDRVRRIVDCTTHITVVSTEVTALARGGPLSKYLVPVPRESVLAHMTAATRGGDLLTVKKSKQTREGHDLYKVMLRKPVASGDTVELTLTQYFLDSQQPLPAEIRQGERHLVVYSGNVFLPSPYVTHRQTTTVKMASTVVESVSEVPPTQHRRDTVVYGPYDEQPAFAFEELRVHFENLAPFVTAESVEREIEVSHWGNVAVEEHYTVRNTGAALTGGFSRLDYQMKSRKGSSFRKFVCMLPEGATGLYYRDIIGNISTSATRLLDDGIELRLEARFPLFGGWKTQWYHGYNLPLANVVTVSSDGDYTMDIAFGPSLQDAAVRELQLNLVLPEGARDVRVSPPDTGVSQSRSKRYTYLDTPFGGREVVKLSTTNYVDAMQGRLRVHYRLPPLYMWREPMLLVATVFALFVAYILLSRIDLTLK